jgi:hypothetical protein
MLCSSAVEHQTPSLLFCLFKLFRAAYYALPKSLPHAYFPFFGKYMGTTITMYFS